MEEDEEEAEEVFGVASALKHTTEASAGAQVPLRDVALAELGYGIRTQAGRDAAFGTKHAVFKYFQYAV